MMLLTMAESSSLVYELLKWVTRREHDVQYDPLNLYIYSRNFG